MTTLTRTPGTAVTVVAWTLQTICAAMFFFAGGSKFVGEPTWCRPFKPSASGSGSAT